MPNEKLPIVGSIPYRGKRLTIVVDDKQWRSFRLYQRQEFRVTPALAKNSDKLMKEYYRFLDSELKKIIDKHFRKLLDKKITYEIGYTDGTKKRQRISAREYAKLIGFTVIKYVTGNYTQEWGINQANSKKKEFILHFNLNLLMYDNNEKIGYVVAHEIAHIFERGHDRAFRDVLEKIYPGGRKYERFWDKEFTKI